MDVYENETDATYCNEQGLDNPGFEFQQTIKINLQSREFPKITYPNHKVCGSGIISLWLCGVFHCCMRAGLQSGHSPSGPDLSGHFPPDLQYCEDIYGPENRKMLLTSHETIQCQPEMDQVVSWRAVFWGLGLQFAIGLFIIRTEPGLVASQWLGDQIRIFLDYTKAGSSFVFGENLINEAFAFQALPIVVFFSSVMSVLYYLGIMQWVIAKIAWIMQITMGTSAAETLSVAGNIFVGQTEAPLLIRPYLPLMTKSEIHAVMTGGFATIAGSVMGAYISFGIDASSLISASVMAAPCALALAKLSYPETQESSFKTMEKIKVDAGGEQNILEAASSGASASVVIVANIAVNLIAFIAILEFINATLRWLGSMVSYPEITFQMICSYVFMPVTFMMGIPYAEAFVAAELIGTKLFLNEFVAYKKLSELKNNRLNDTGSGGQLLSLRSETICTYALCGFANFSSLGIMIGGLSSICPSKRGDISQAVLRALLTGTCVSLVNACLAGMLYNSLDCIDVFRKVTFNSTSSDINQCCTDIFGSTLWNGTAMDFTGSWNGVKNATLYFTNCCNIYNNTKYC
nr:sodium/nucleoside cotransporter 1-like isoform X2 [Paramormyrops kingsleyae]